jgi:mevalonate kinase
LDPAVAVINRPIIFQNRKIVEILDAPYWPYLMLSYSGENSPTSECVKIVNDSFKKNIENAIALDDQMNEASALCEIGLKTSNLKMLADGIELGHKVFRKWNLCTSNQENHMAMLLSKGAMAAKPTGSGLGGFVISLWEKKPTTLISNNNNMFDIT